MIFAAMGELARVGGTAIVHAENQDLIDELGSQLEAEGHAGRRWEARADDAASRARPSTAHSNGARRGSAPAGVTSVLSMPCASWAPPGARPGGLRRGVPALPAARRGRLRRAVLGPAPPVGPPLRDSAHRDALWDALGRGAIDIVSTDHGPRRSILGDDGERVIPAGTSGLEVRLALVHTCGVRAGRLSLQRFVDACCTRPAEVFGLARKGRLEAGYEADIVLFDPERRVTLTAAELHSDIDHSTYEGWVCEGAPVTTIVRGEIVVADGELQVEAGHGHFVEREARR